MIAARDGDAYLSASCYYDATVAFIATLETRGPRKLALGFDGAAPVPQPWLWRSLPAAPLGRSRSARYTPIFTTAVEALRQHREVEAVVTDARGKVLDVHFSLEGAGAALDLAFKNCPA